jgi:hypothetical protein
MLSRLANQAHPFAANPIAAILSSPFSRAPEDPSCVPNKVEGKRVLKRFHERSAELQIPRLRSELVTLLSSGISSRPENSQEHLPASIAGVLRLRAMSPLFAIDLRSASLRMTFFVAGLKYSWLGMQKTRKIEKVTASRDDKAEGGCLQPELV